MLPTSTHAASPARPEPSRARAPRQVVEINTHTDRVVRTIPGLAQVHGVLVVPALHRVYATATAANMVVRINEDTGRVLGQTATGGYPDGLAYDPANRTIWTTNESGGSETIIDAATGAPAT
jgi:DNA-binding beta-propeller fold protein YncE